MGPRTCRRTAITNSKHNASRISARKTFQDSRGLKTPTRTSVRYRTMRVLSSCRACFDRSSSDRRTKKSPNQLCNVCKVAEVCNVVPPLCAGCTGRSTAGHAGSIFSCSAYNLCMLYATHTTSAGLKGDDE